MPAFETSDRAAGIIAKELAPHLTVVRNFVACHGDPNGE